jgi:glycerol-3-phosphate acyltransferase PlsX
MKIIVDAMGGDFAPDEIVKGAVRAAQELSVGVILVGKGEEILKSLDRAGYGSVPDGVEIANATETIEMCEDPVTAIRNKRDSSMVVGLRMLKDSQGDAMVSAGSTGALLSGATLIVKRIKGIRRASLAPMIPNKKNGTIIIDAGANSDCTPEYLVQFALMGSYYAGTVLGFDNPRVGLLNIGTEESKGAALQVNTYPLLQKLHEEGRINFVGNVEAKSIMDGVCDVLVCDGFCGNVLLKAIEGMSKFLGREIKNIFLSGKKSKVAYLAVREGFNDLADRMNADNVGGTVMLGISGVVVKAHGSSRADAIVSAIRNAKIAVEKQVPQGIKEHVDALRMGLEDA